MRRAKLSAAAFAVALILGLDTLWAADQPPEPDVPWGKAVDGLACRLLVPSEFCVGEAVHATVEIKNVSGETRYLVSVFDILFPEHARLAVMGPDAKPLKPSQSAQTSPGPASLKPIESGQVLRIEFPDLGRYFCTYDMKSKSMRSDFDTPGTYDLTYTFIGMRLPKRMAVGERIDNGGVTKIFETIPDEKDQKTWAGTLASSPAAFTIRELGPEDLQVHEWGVFTVFNDVQYANADQKAEWASLPPVFYRQFPTRRLKWAPSSWNKPILYFYSKRPALKLAVSLTFAQGAPVVWWPCVARPVNDSVRSVEIEPTKPSEVFRTLEWTPWLGDRIPVDGIAAPGREAWKAVSETELPAALWLQEARLKGATLLSVAGTSLGHKPPWASGETETDRFIFYDGLVPAPDTVRCTKAGPGSVTLRNAASFPIQGIFLVDRRAVERVAFAHVAEALAPDQEREIALQPVAAADWPAAAMGKVREALVAAGLFEAEALAILKIWHEGFFGRPGVTALYLLPRAEYDRMLALAISPKPKRIVRVGIALHPDLTSEPALAERAQRLVQQLEGGPEAERDAAARDLAQMGPVAWRVVREALIKNPPPETEKRLKEILDQTDAAEWLRPKP